MFVIATNSAVMLQVVKVWDMCSGKKTFEFSVGRSGISTIDIDKSGKRYLNLTIELCVCV